MLMLLDNEYDFENKSINSFKHFSYLLFDIEK